MRRAQGFDEIITALAAGDKTAEHRLVEILRQESNSGAQTSDGLRIVDAWLGGPVRRFLASTTLGSFQSEIDHVWNNMLNRIYLSINDYDRDKSRLRTWIYNLARYEAMDLVRDLTRAINRERLALADLPMDLHEVDVHPLGKLRRTLQYRTDKLQRHFGNVLAVDH